MAASPSVFLSAVAQRTRRLRFGPLVYALPLYHPLRMIEEICMLDQMSGGRLEMGFGRGSVPEELIYYGQKPDEAQQVYAEALELIIEGLTERTLTSRGIFRFDAVPMELTPCRSLTRRSGTGCTHRRARRARRARVCGWLASIRSPQRVPLRRLSTSFWGVG